MERHTEERIKAVLHRCINNTLTRTARKMDHKPFHEALLSSSIVKASAFERSFSTSFGQGPIEEISLIVAEANGYTGKRQKESYIDIYKGASDEISRIIEGLRDGSQRPNWMRELRRLGAFTKGDTVPKRVISDLWLEKDGRQTFISIKTVKPNLDQTQQAKYDMLVLKAHDPKWDTYFGLYYNPGGPTRANYNWDIPGKLFDMVNDPCILIGEDYWDFLGGRDTYQQLIRLFVEVGALTRDQLSHL